MNQGNGSDRPAAAEYLSALEAAARLGVKVETLYAYTSRGLVQSVPSGRGPARRYLRADVERLRARGAVRRGGGEPRGPALRFGEPVLDTSITWLAQDEGPLYRGHAAVELAERDTPFEAVAELLWGGELAADLSAWRVHELGVPQGPLLALAASTAAGGTPLADPTALLPLVVAGLAARDLDRFETSPDAVAPRARRLVRRMTAALALTRGPGDVEAALAAPTVPESLAIALGTRRSDRALRALNAALVLLADHELNASTFAARVAASTRADLYACFLAGLATLAGPLHGAASERARAFVEEVSRPERAEGAIRARLRRGEPVPGFGHVVYRSGDPRVRPLMDRARALAPRSRRVRTVEAVIDAMREAGRPGPNVDTALVALAAAVGLPPGSGPALFAIARGAGWAAHALEQYRADFLVRPRARYLEVT